MTANSKAVLDFVRENDGSDFTYKEVASALGLKPQSVNGSITAFSRHKDLEGNAAPVMVREEKEVELEDGTHEKVKFIRLTDFGRTYDPEAEDAAREKEKEAKKAAKAAEKAAE